MQGFWIGSGSTIFTGPCSTSVQLRLKEVPIIQQELGYIPMCSNIHLITDVNTVNPEGEIKFHISNI